ncbi:hypothetical protein [Bradyrhizobium iriomotense]|uniref:Uncharacterized protein n=1 Tax=Bradyrhizobium iriomotense TaxID=441950 RepID=A0ABQ6B382_9BRAD|nr:hypothetical protein [Bradyrhizobium iriomotense]GLR86522.1 hypothetical protein GCM10007857_32330 [Bradyrhizobium iriomotense]
MLRFCFLLSFVAIVLIFKISNAATAAVTGDTSKSDRIALTKEIILERNSASSQPFTINSFGDGDLLITAAENHPIHKASVTRVDSNGKVKWRYYASLQVLPENLSASPEFHGAIVMPDSSSFECGQMVRQEPGFHPGIAGHESLLAMLTHLDADGRLLGEQVLHPQSEPDHAYGSFSRCAHVADTVLALGIAFRATPKPAGTQGPPGKLDYFYWIMAFDEAGNAKWEHLFPISSKLVGLPHDISQIQETKNGFAFAAARRGMTEVVSMSLQGDMRAQTVLDGMFSIARPTFSSPDLQLTALVTDKVVSVTLDSNLHETKRFSVDHEVGEAKIAYRSSDQSLVLFGDAIIPDKPDYNTRISILDSTLQHSQDFYFVPKDNSAWVEAATPTSGTNDFAAIRIIDKPAVTHDLVLDFVHVR